MSSGICVCCSYTKCNLDARTLYTKYLAISSTWSQLPSLGVVPLLRAFLLSPGMFSRHCCSLLRTFFSNCCTAHRLFFLCFYVFFSLATKQQCCPSLALALLPTRIPMLTTTLSISVICCCLEWASPSPATTVDILQKLTSF